MESWVHFGSLGCRTGEDPFFYVSILFLGSVAIQVLDTILESVDPIFLTLILVVEESIIHEQK